ncbi:hypothetical protein EGW08_016788 [Elysia chlorotica]|uniref:Ras-associating domain-containing protein n=1 Tax=Elysia chlorotica TaxID=188477 RepID=A0A433T1K5_ELYCH|nr:hypothetical protein EGW08_016788 [Elysia chlorotica]
MGKFRTVQHCSHSAGNEQNVRISRYLCYGTERGELDCLRVMDPGEHERDIPVWFSGTQRWMAGLTRRTTCDDVIYAILYSSGLHEAEATENYAIFEKWREVERPLSSRTKILKVWASWGEEQPNVSLSMRSLNEYFLPGESSLYMRSRRRHKKQSRQRSSRHSPTCKCRDRRSCGECCRLKSLEHLVKQVVNQERRLQDLTDHIVDTDRLIEKHEARIHEHRVLKNGLDYVQDSYLNSHSSGSGSSSSVDSASLSVATLDLNEASAVFPQSSLAELDVCRDRRSCGECCRLKSLEHLVKQVVNQERRLQDLTDHIVDTDRLIEKHEARIHENRVLKNGLDYVQDSYLNSHSSGSGSSSSVDSASLSVATLDLNEASAVFPQSSLAELGEVTRMCDQLTHLELRLCVERAKEEELDQEVGRLRQELGPGEREGEADSPGLEEARVELLRAVTSHVTQEYNERMLDRRMESCLAEVQDRAAFLQALQSQLAEVESRLAPSTGSGSVRSDSDTPTNPPDGLSSDSDTDVFVRSQQPQPPQLQQQQQQPQLQQQPQHFHEPTNQQKRDFFEYTTHDNSRSSPNQAHYRSVALGDKHTPRTGLHDTPLLETANQSCRGPSKDPTTNKSLTGRGRFARDPIRRGAGFTAHTIPNAKDQHLSSAHIDTRSSRNADLENKGDYSGTVFLQSGVAGKSYLPVAGSGNCYSVTSGRENINIDRANIGRSGEMDGSEENNALRVGQSSEAANVQPPNIATPEPGLDRTGQYVAKGGPGRGDWTHGARRLPGGARTLQGNAGNSVGSCGDISSLATAPSSHWLEGPSRDARSGRERRQGVQSLAHRRSRSADRDRVHPMLQSQSAKNNTENNTAELGQSRERDYNNRGYNSEEDEIYKDSHRLGVSLVENTHFPNKEKLRKEPNNVDVSISNSFYSGISDAPGAHTVSSTQRGNNGDKGLLNLHHNSTIHTSNKDSSSQNPDSGHGYFSVFEQTKPSRRRNTQGIPNKAQNRSTGFIFRVAKTDRLDTPHANNDAAGKGSEKSVPRNGYSLGTVHDLGVVGLTDVQDSVPRNGAQFVQRIAGNSQSKQGPNSSTPVGNNLSAQPQTRTGLSSHNDARAISSEKRTECSSSQNDRMENKQRQRETANANHTKTAPITNTQTDPSRGALYHILSQKFNASKEKIRLNSNQDAGKDQRPGLPASGLFENLTSAKQSHNQERSSDGVGAVASNESPKINSGPLNQRRQKPLPSSSSVSSSASGSTTADQNFGQIPNGLAPINSSHNSTPHVASDTRTPSHGTNRNPQHSAPMLYSFQDAGSNSIPKQNYNQYKQQNPQYNHQQLQQQTDKPAYLYQQSQQPRTYYPHNQNQQQSLPNQPQSLPNQTQSLPKQHQSHPNQQHGLPNQEHSHPNQQQNHLNQQYNHSHHHQYQHQQQQQVYHQQNRPVPNGYHRNQDHPALNHQGEATTPPPNPETTTTTPHRRSALNPHFYDMNKTGETKLHPPEQAPNSQNSKKPNMNGTAELIDYQHNHHKDADNNTRIISYLQKSNSGFLESLKSGPSLPQSFRSPASSNSLKVTDANPARVTATGTAGGFSPAVSSAMMHSGMKSDQFLDLSEPRKTSKAKMEDSNDSDTGLSSMHSDETANMETLV